MAILFAVPKWVDTRKAAGKTSQLPWVLQIPRTYLRNVVTLRTISSVPPSMFMLLLAIFMHFVDPYDFESANAFGFCGEAQQQNTFGTIPVSAWVVRRLCSNCLISGLFYSFFLFVPRWGCERKFNPTTAFPCFSQILHDVWYWFLGILQWTFWECLIVRACATGRISLVASNEEIVQSFKFLSSQTDSTDGFPFYQVMPVVATLFWMVFSHTWRSPHFYFCHRLIHFRPFYRAFHGLHHRNVDVNAFSGLAMHPVEHLYYFSSMFFPLGFSCVFRMSLLPPEVLKVSPLVLRYAGYLPVLAPGATHSGFEDHFLCQQEHYVHHIAFNKNFGAGPACYLDYLFGTFSDRILGGGAESEEDAPHLKDPSSPLADSSTRKHEDRNRSRARGGPGNTSGRVKYGSTGKFFPPWPSSSFDATFIGLCLLLFAVLFQGVSLGDAHDGNRINTSNPSLSRYRSSNFNDLTNANSTMELHATAFLVTCGPLVASIILWAAFKDSMSLRWPFEQEPVRYSIFHLCAGVLVCVLPVYCTILSIL